MTKAHAPAMKCPPANAVSCPLRKRLMASVVVLTELNHMPWPGAAVPALAAGGYLAGAAKIEITPRSPIWLSGYAARTKPSTGVMHPLWAKAVAIRDARNTTVVIAPATPASSPITMTAQPNSRVRRLTARI